MEQANRMTQLSGWYKKLVVLSCLVLIVSGLVSFVYDALQNVEGFIISFFFDEIWDLLLILWGITALVTISGKMDHKFVRVQKRVYWTCLIFFLINAMLTIICAKVATILYPPEKNGVIAYTGIPEYYISFIGEIILVGVICLLCLYGIQKNKKIPEWLKQVAIITSAVLVIESVYSFFLLPADLFVLFRFGFHIVLVKIAQLTIFMGIFKKNRMVETLFKQDVDLSFIQNP